MVWQHTLGAPISCNGVGLHTGRPIQMRLKPAPVGSGILFVRTDRPAGHNQIHLSVDQVIDTHRGTKIANAHACEIGTVEHLLAALMAYNIDNVQIEVDGPEIPAMDGGAAVFTERLADAKVLQQTKRRKYIQVLREISIESENSTARFLPADRFQIDVGISYDNPLIGQQSCQFDVNTADFVQQIARARTFVLRSEIETLMKSGIAKGGSLDNCLIVDTHQIENKGGLHFANEFARHKAMDALGDLALAGAPILGRYEARQGGHRINHLALRTLLSDTSAWKFDECPSVHAQEPCPT